MQPKLFIVTGVNGIGKSTVITELVSKLDPERYKVHDFDERGVPDSADKGWRESETVHWLEVAKQNAASNITTIVCGFMKVADIEQAMVQVPDVQTTVCLLDGSPEVIADRLMSRYQTPESLAELERTTGKTSEKFIADNVWVSTKFREAAEEKAFNSIDTSDKSPAEVADAIIEWLS
jgi:thymidylate kinase